MFVNLFSLLHIYDFQEALKNILIVFAKLNPGIRYVQGMNEILAPLFYVFKNDPTEENAVSNVSWSTYTISTLKTYNLMIQKNITLCMSAFQLIFLEAFSMFLIDNVPCPFSAA